MEGEGAKRRGRERRTNHGTFADQVDELAKTS